jgi:hypothetical protein
MPEAAGGRLPAREPEQYAAALPPTAPRVIVSYANHRQGRLGHDGRTRNLDLSVR